MTRAAERPRVRTDLGQTEFWRGGDGLIRFVDDMDERYRANCVRFLVDHAAAYHYRNRQHWYDWGRWLSHGPYDAVPDEVMDEWERQDTRKMIRREQDRGEHLNWMHGTPMFRRLLDGVEDVVAQWPGVLPCATVAVGNDGQTTEHQEP